LKEKADETDRTMRIIGSYCGGKVGRNRSWHKEYKCTDESIEIVC
jgi:hypothetical protein